MFEKAAREAHAMFLKDEEHAQGLRLLSIDEPDAYVKFFREALDEQIEESGLK